MNGVVKPMTLHLPPFNFTELQPTLYVCVCVSTCEQGYFPFPKDLASLMRKGEILTEWKRKWEASDTCLPFPSEWFPTELQGNALLICYGGGFCVAKMFPLDGLSSSQAGLFPRNFGNRTGRQMSILELWGVAIFKHMNWTDGEPGWQGCKEPVRVWLEGAPVRNSSPSSSIPVAEFHETPQYAYKLFCLSLFKNSI